MAMPEIPEEAIEAAARKDFEEFVAGAELRLVNGEDTWERLLPGEREEFLVRARINLAAAQSALYAAHRKQVEAEVRERFEPLVESAQGILDHKRGEILPRIERVYLDALQKALKRAALDTLEADRG